MTSVRCRCALPRWIDKKILVFIKAFFGHTDEKKKVYAFMAVKFLVIVTVLDV